jgi:predicted deacetylase
MNWRIWERVEATLARNDVKPIIAVVPDNRDPALTIDPPAPDFWERVRHWQSQGWGIALHGYQHIYVNTQRGMLGLMPHSEFATLPEAEQRRKISAGVAILKEHGITPDAWIAPSHSFDEVTLKALMAEGISVVSDGLALDVYTDSMGAIWIPQQMPCFRPRRKGTWTVCYHHNNWSPSRIDDFEREVGEYRSKIVSLQDVIRSYTGRKRNILDRIYCHGRIFGQESRLPYARGVVEFIHDITL